MLTEKELQALKYTGLLGHEFIVLRPDLKTGAECNTLASAKENAKECNGQVYQQLPGRKFKKLA